MNKLRSLILSVLVFISIVVLCVTKQYLHRTTIKHTPISIQLPDVPIPTSYFNTDMLTRYDDLPKIPTYPNISTYFPNNRIYEIDQTLTNNPIGKSPLAFRMARNMSNSLNSTQYADIYRMLKNLERFRSALSRSRATKPTINPNINGIPKTPKYTPKTFLACEVDAPNRSLSLEQILRYTGMEVANDSSKIVEALPGYTGNNLTEVLQSTQFSPLSIRFDNPGFVSTVVEAYNNHVNLVIRPDDIWAAIMTQFSFYVNKHAEKYRSKFVNFEGQRHLVVSTPGSLRSASYNWFVNAMTDEIKKNLASPVKDWVLPSFTTTTENDLVTVGVVFMASVQKYFTYESFLMCGIPWITIDGTKEDWQNILERLEMLKEYDLQPWYELLHPIIAKFMDVKEGKIDKAFWQAIVDRRAGSGFDYISGWITAFCVFNVEGDWQRGVEGMRGTTPLQKWLRSNQTAAISDEEKEGGQDMTWLSNPALWPAVDMADIPSGIVEVEVKINENGKEHQSLMLAGHMAAEVTKKNGWTLKPSLGWAIALKP